MPTLITADLVLIGPSSDRIPDGAVLVDADLITAVGPRAALAEQAPDATTMRFPGATVLPGLINSHVYLAMGTGRYAPAELRDQHDNKQLFAAMGERARQLLDTGITTARDVGDRDGLAAQLRDAIRDDQIPGPRVLTAGAPLTTPGGHLYFLGGEIEDPEDPDRLRAAVRARRDAGADLVMVMASGGGTTPGAPPMWAPQFAASQLCTIVEQAHELELPVAAHAHGTASIRAAVAAGVDNIEHCTWMEPDQTFTSRSEIGDVVDQITATDTAICQASNYDWDLFRRMLDADTATELLDRLHWLSDRGVTLIHGTEAGMAKFTDLSLPRLTNWGFTPEQLLDMATTHAAAALGLATTTGSLHPGYDADLLIVDGDPTRDITALANIEMVMTRGRSHYPHHS